MNILIIGNGGREHAFARALSQDKKVQTLYMLPKRASVKEAEAAPLSCLGEEKLLLSWIKQKQIDLVIIGPEKPLIEGLGDFLREQGINVFGPSQKAAQLEGSKIFSKEFMKEQGILTASYQIVSSVQEALQASKNFSPPYVLKADGLAGGKGVFICETVQELEEQASFLFKKKALGEAGSRAVLEDFQSGIERSIFVLTNGKDYALLPVAQDYKRLLDGQKGLNTGGMGAIAPIDIPPDLMKNIEEGIVKPTLQGLQKNNYPYFGILYIGLMVSSKGARVLEYNVRFGDPEAQVLLPLLEGSWADVFYQISQGKLPSLKWKDLHAACVVLTSSGYPLNPKAGIPIEGLIYHQTPNAYFLHAGVGQSEEGQWVTQGGRVLNAIALGESREEALKRAYDQVSKASWEGERHRKDIGS